MFDSREYEFADLTLVLGGKDITGFRGVKYTVKQEKEPSRIVAMSFCEPRS